MFVQHFAKVLVIPKFLSFLSGETWGLQGWDDGCTVKAMSIFSYVFCAGKSHKHNYENGKKIALNFSSLVIPKFNRRK